MENDVVWIANLDTHEIVGTVQADVEGTLAELGWTFENVLLSSEFPDAGDIACANGDREVAAYWEQVG